MGVTKLLTLGFTQTLRESMCSSKFFSAKDISKNVRRQWSFSRYEIMSSNSSFHEVLRLWNLEK